jgi:hypothetical protein
MGTAVVVILIVLAVAAVLFLKQTGGNELPVQQTEAPKPAGPKRHWLVGKGGEIDGKTWHIGNRKVTIGRAASNFVQVNAENVSRQQCQLIVEGEAMTLIDMTSSNGTVLNGAPIDKATLKDGDVIQVGEARLVYRAEGDFGTNAAWQPKAAGAEVDKTTRAMTAEQARRLALAHQLFEHHGQDRGKAAEAMGVSEEEFQNLLDQ